MTKQTEKYKIFTWNMQRGANLDPKNKKDRPAAEARLNLLKTLCNQSDIAFITEPGKDIRQRVENKSMGRLIPGIWRDSPLHDNQSDDSACRPILFFNQSRFRANDIKTIKLAFKSGKVDASRNPAIAGISLGGEKVNFVAIHVTSGGGARDNFMKFIKKIESYSKTKAELFVIGGDLNYHSRSLQMPLTPTQKSGNAIDGFDFMSAQDDLFAEFTNVEAYERKSIFRWHDWLTTNADTSRHGYVAGFHHRISFFSQPQRVSDHAPVTADLKITYDDYIDEQPRKRARKK